ncbi:trypsin-like peptidase domain-containing protein, partial [Desulforudis sp. 1190]|uniref:trypsin-like peptidase domain-containing protein n=1 Tax=Desulforudis sp. 1190 TaxID=3416136 RepID=UPI003CED3946
VDPLTTATLPLTLWAGDEQIGTGSGFLVEHAGHYNLITNRHVLRGRHAFTGEVLDARGRRPDRVQVTFLRKGVNERTIATYLLLDNFEPRWLEHPELGGDADVVAFPIPIPDGLLLSPVNIDPLVLGPPQLRLVVSVARTVFIVGYPLGLTGGAPAAAIWIQGTIATEMELNYFDRPIFLVDSNTRKGLSGSPVYAYVPAGGTPVRDTTTGHRMLMGFVDPEGDGTQRQFIGIYAGRVSE